VRVPVEVGDDLASYINVYVDPNERPTPVFSSLAYPCGLNSRS